MDALYKNESMKTYWLQNLGKYWEEEDTTYSDDFDFWPEWLFRYYHGLTLGQAIESAYLMWTS